MLVRLQQDDLEQGTYPPEPCFSICEMVVRLTLLTSQAYYGGQIT